MQLFEIDLRTFPRARAHTHVDCIKIRSTYSRSRSMNSYGDVEKMEAVSEGTGRYAGGKEHEKHVFNVFKAVSVTLWLRHCTRDYST